MYYFEIPRRALVVAQDEQARSRLTRACRLGGYTVAQQSLADAASTLTGANYLNLVLVDMPDGSPDELDCVARIRAAPGGTHLPIIVTCPTPCPASTVTALEAGADDVARRPGSFEELLARIRAVVRRRSPELAHDEVSYGPLTVRPGAREVVVSIKGEHCLARVSPTEFRLLHFFVTYPGVIHSRTVLRGRLWPANGPSISERTIDVHIKRLRRTLAKAGLQPSIETVLKLGYRMDLPVGVRTA